MTLVEMIKDFAWYMNVFGVLLILFARFSSNTKNTWLGVGLILLIIALGNALVVAASGLRPAETAASLVGLVVLGTLGARFVGNWLTERAI